MKYKIWDKKESLVTPIGEVLTAAQIIERYPSAALPAFNYIICDAPISMGVFMEVTQTVEHFKQRGVQITDTMTHQEALNAISFFEENPPAPQPTPDERMAAALEFQSMMLL